MTLSNKFSYEKVSEEALHPYHNAKSIYANYFDIKSKKELDSLERSLSSIRQAELVLERTSSFLPPQKVLNTLYSFEFYTDIHLKLFCDLYPWAGKIRNFDMAYDGHVFTCAEKLVFYGEKVFTEFKQKVKEGFCTQFLFVKESARFLNLINTLHPFPDGNGRTQRIIMNLHFNYHGFSFNWSNIHQWEIYETLKQSFEGNREPLERLLDKHLEKIS